TPTGCKRQVAGGNDPKGSSPDRRLGPGAEHRGLRQCVSCAGSASQSALYVTHATIESRRLNILIYAHSFAPQIGGAETYVMNLARGLTNGGTSAGGNLGRSVDVDVTVATSTPANGFDDRVLPFRVARRPGLRES